MYKGYAKALAYTLLWNVTISKVEADYCYYYLLYMCI